MLKQKRMGFSGLIIGLSVAAMFLVGDMLDIDGYWYGKKADNEQVTVIKDESSCVSLRDAARGVMQARQVEAEREVVAEELKPLGKDGEFMLALAYEYPVGATLQEKEQIIMEFASGVQAKCLSVLASIKQESN